MTFKSEFISEGFFSSNPVKTAKKGLAQLSKDIDKGKLKDGQKEDEYVKILTQIKNELETIEDRKKRSKMKSEVLSHFLNRPYLDDIGMGISTGAKLVVDVFPQMDQGDLKRKY